MPAITQEQQDLLNELVDKVYVPWFSRESGYDAAYELMTVVFTDDERNFKLGELPEHLLKAPVEAHMFAFAEGLKRNDWPFDLEDFAEDFGLTTAEWFSRIDNWESRRGVQFGCHLEEVAEMFPEISSGNVELDAKMALIAALLNEVGSEFKKGHVDLKIVNRDKFGNSLYDQLVTATGTLTFNSYEVAKGMAEVNWSNFSKFVNGEVLYKEGGKVDKGPFFWDPDKDYTVK